MRYMEYSRSWRIDTYRQINTEDTILKYGEQMSVRKPGKRERGAIEGIRHREVSVTKLSGRRIGPWQHVRSGRPNRKVGGAMYQH